MKILLSWLFDHILTKREDVSVVDIVAAFNKTVAEIEHFNTIGGNNNLIVAKITEIKDESSIAKDVVSGQDVVLPLRKNIAINQLYVVAYENEGYRFATMKDMGGTKEAILPTVFVKEEEYNSIPALLSSEDVIIDIDNKSITHRPDLWSHRGIAREVAAMFDLKLKSIESLLAQTQVTSADVEITSTEKSPFSITIEDTAHCKRFAGLYVDEIKHTPTPLWMAIRLARLDSKPINALIDLTNYVLFDIGQSMHVFDAEKLCKKRIIVRKADDGEVLKTLDDEQTTLSKEDIVIADGLHPVSLAGIMGGKETSVTGVTTSVFLESANFDATTIRRSAGRLKKRTESSMRFEKSLDPHQNVTAINRYIQLLDEIGISYRVSGNIQSVGTPPSKRVLQVSHELIEKKLGLSLAWQKVQSILHALDFDVQKQETNVGVLYDVTIPTFRATKDITIVEDVIEEIGRFIGYENIMPVLPTLPLRPRDITATNRKREVKKLLSYVGRMRELYTYAFFDESFLQSINWSPDNYIDVKNPVSQNYARLVTTLLPNLFKALQENAEQYRQVRFYEWARIWKKQHDGFSEQHVVSGLMYDQDNAIDFYTGKTLVENIYSSIGMQVEYQSITNQEYPWQHPYQSAHITHNDEVIGSIGMITNEFVEKLTPGGAIFYFECDAQILMEYKPAIVKYKAASKYPPVVRDISMTVPLSERVRNLQTMIAGVDSRIIDVVLVDSFEKNEWHDKRAITVRLTIQDENTTLTSDDADAVCSRVYDVVKTLGAEIR